MFYREHKLILCINIVKKINIDFISIYRNLLILINNYNCLSRFISGYIGIFIDFSQQLHQVNYKHLSIHLLRYLSISCDVFRYLSMYTNTYRIILLYINEYWGVTIEKYRDMQISIDKCHYLSISIDKYPRYIYKHEHISIRIDKYRDIYFEDLSIDKSINISIHKYSSRSIDTYCNIKISIDKYRDISINCLV